MYAFILKKNCLKPPFSELSGSYFLIKRKENLSKQHWSIFLSLPYPAALWSDKLPLTVLPVQFLFEFGK